MSPNSLIRYFDLGSESRPSGAQATSGADRPAIHVLPQYLALFAGILVQPFFQRYMTIGVWDLNGFAAWLIGSCVLALMVFPGVYKNAFDPEKPVFVHLCVIFTAGTGWQTLASTAMKAAGAAK